MAAGAAQSSTRWYFHGFWMEFGSIFGGLGELGGHFGSMVSASGGIYRHFFGRLASGGLSRALCLPK